MGLGEIFAGFALAGELHVDTVAANDRDGPQHTAAAPGGEEGRLAHICGEQDGEDSGRNIQTAIAGSGVGKQVRPVFQLSKNLKSQLRVVVAALSTKYHAVDHKSAHNTENP